MTRNTCMYCKLLRMSFAPNYSTMLHMFACTTPPPPPHTHTHLFWFFNLHFPILIIIQVFVEFSQRFKITETVCAGVTKTEQSTQMHYTALSCGRHSTTKTEKWKWSNDFTATWAQRITSHTNRLHATLLPIPYSQVCSILQLHLLYKTLALITIYQPYL